MKITFIIGFLVVDLRYLGIDGIMELRICSFQDVIPSSWMLSCPFWLYAVLLSVNLYPREHLALQIKKNSLRTLYILK
jgi:hypothetical protein